MKSTKMPMSREELKRRYLAYVDRVATDIDWKTSFGPEEICEMIYTILETPDKPGWYPVLYCGITNLNDRYYSCDEVDEHMEDLKKRVKSAAFFGELGYPDNMEINLRRVSHLILDVKFEHGVLWAKIEPREGDNGDVLRGMLERDEVVFRPRMTGSMRDNSKLVKIDSFITFDAILKTEDAFR